MGTDSERFTKLRGLALDGVAVDEAQDHSSLSEIVKETLSPATGRVDGWFLIAGTPPKDGAHDWITLYTEARSKGMALTHTTLECPRYTEKQLKRWCDDQRWP